MSEKETTLKEDMLLDVRDLDRAALDQTIIFKKWAEKWASAVYERDKVKDKIKAKRADLAKQIRANPDKFGGQDGKKISESKMGKPLSDKHKLSIKRTTKKIMIEMREKFADKNIHIFYNESTKEKFQGTSFHFRLKL